MSMGKGTPGPAARGPALYMAGATQHMKPFTEVYCLFAVTRGGREELMEVHGDYDKAMARRQKMEDRANANRSRDTFKVIARDVL